MKFKKYQHIERFGNDEVENINIGKCYIFPKIEGTNGSVWLDNDQIMSGSRNRQLTIDNDNAGFYKKIISSPNIIKFLLTNPKYRLFGEWLVPHSLKIYRDDVWRKFYIFDVVTDKELSENTTNQEKFNYLSYDEYQPLLEQFNLDYIIPLKIINNPSYDQLIKELDKNYFLIEDGKGVGEGIIIKNYEYFNKYHRQTWAKIVRSEFKELHNKTMGAPTANGKNMMEEDIIDKFLTEALIEKEYNKIKTEMNGWSSKYIPRLLNTIYYCLITEEMWNILKKYKKCKIDFGLLNYFTILKIKQIKKELF